MVTFQVSVVRRADVVVDERLVHVDRIDVFDGIKRLNQAAEPPQRQLPLFSNAIILFVSFNQVLNVHVPLKLCPIQRVELP